MLSQWCHHKLVIRIKLHMKFMSLNFWILKVTDLCHCITNLWDDPHIIEFAGINKGWRFHLCSQVNNYYILWVMIIAFLPLVKWSDANRYCPLSSLRTFSFHTVSDDLLQSFTTRSVHCNIYSSFLLAHDSIYAIARYIKKVKAGTTLHGNPISELRTSVAMCDHTVLPATRHKWMRPA